MKLFEKDLVLTELIDWVYRTFTQDYKYIMRVDADDVVAEGAINILRSEIEKDLSLGSVCGSWLEIDGNSNTLNRMILENGYASSAFHGACTLFRSEAIKDIKFKINNVKSQDGLFTWLKIKDKWKCKTISEFIFQYRRHDNNLSNKEEKLFFGRCRAYEAIFEEKKLKSNVCAVIGYNDDETADMNVDVKSNLLQQIKFIQDSRTISKLFISSDSNILEDISLNDFPKASVLNRSKTSESLIRSLQKSENLKNELTNYSDILLLNPLKNIWNSNFIDLGIYTKYVHAYKSVIACNLIKGTVFNEENGNLRHVNFSNLNTVFTSNFLFIKLPGFLLVGSDDFYSIGDNYPDPIGHVSNNFLSLNINSN